MPSFGENANNYKGGNMVFAFIIVFVGRLQSGRTRDESQLTRSSCPGRNHFFNYFFLHLQKITNYFIKMMT